MRVEEGSWHRLDHLSSLVFHGLRHGCLVAVPHPSLTNLGRGKMDCPKTHANQTWKAEKSLRETENREMFTVRQLAEYPLQHVAFRQEDSCI